jgi:hypothetical protein
MKAKTRQMPGSTRNCRTPLSRSGPHARRFQSLTGKGVHYAYKMRPYFETQILTNAASDTYTLDPQKCTHLPCSVEWHSAVSRGGTRHTVGSRGIGPANHGDIPSHTSQYSPNSHHSRPNMATKPAILDKMRLLRLRLSAMTCVFRTNRTTILRLVSFCPVRPTSNLGGTSSVESLIRPASPAFVSISVHSWLPKMRRNETNPKTRKSDPLRLRHLRCDPRGLSHFGDAAPPTSAQLDILETKPMTLKMYRDRRPLSPLPRGEGQGEGQTGTRSLRSLAAMDFVCNSWLVQN